MELPQWIADLIAQSPLYVIVALLMFYQLRTNRAWQKDQSDLARSLLELNTKQTNTIASFETTLQEVRTELVQSRLRDESRARVEEGSIKTLQAIGDALASLGLKLDKTHAETCADLDGIATGVQAGNEQLKAQNVALSVIDQKVTKMSGDYPELLAKLDQLPANVAKEIQPGIQEVLDRLKALETQNTDLINRLSKSEAARAAAEAELIKLRATKPAESGGAAT